MTHSTTDGATASAWAPEPLQTAAVRPMLDRRRGYWILFALLSLALLAGLGAWIYQLIFGLGVTGLTNEVTWGYYTVDLVTFIGLSYGGALVSAILRLVGASWRLSITRIAEATALVALVVGAVFPIIHLGRPERIWRMFTDPRGSSPMIWDMFAILTYLLATIVFFVLPVVADMGELRRWSGFQVGRARKRLARWLASGWTGSEGQHRVLGRALTVVAIVIIPIAVYVHSVLAWAFSVNSRHGWHSTLFAPYFVIAALFSGVALVILAASIYRWAYRLEAYITPRQIRNLGLIMLTLGLIYAYMTFAEYLTEGYTATEEGMAIVSMFLVGRYAALFWGWLLVGLLVPILLVALPFTRNVVGITTASILVIVGMWVKRILIVVPPMELPLIGEGLNVYTPSWVEITLTAAAVAAIPWGLMLLFRFVPVLPVAEMLEARHAVAERTASSPAGAAAASEGGAS